MSENLSKQEGHCGTARHKRAAMWLRCPHLAVVVVLGMIGCGEGSPPTGGPDAADGSDAFAADGSPSSFVLSESFSINGPSWPIPWSQTGGILVADVVGGRGRLVPFISSYSLARMDIPGDELDVDIRFDVEFAELATQGLGFYARQSGGYLTQSTPPGAGYAVFIEGFRGPPAIGVWREVDGNESMIQIVQDPTPSMSSGVVYTTRFQVQQDGTTTRLRAKIWPRDEAEPNGWAVDASDSTASLQNLTGGFAVDAWSSYNISGQSADDVFFDNLEIHRLD